VLVIGAGGLGAPALLYLAAASAGTIGVIDDDKVALSNGCFSHDQVDDGAECGSLLDREVGRFSPATAPSRRTAARKTPADRPVTLQ
jgi:hypothetical protein